MIRINEMAVGGIDSQSKDIIRDYKLSSLEKFYKRTSSELKELKDESFNRDIFLTKENGVMYISRMEERKKEIEKTIKLHRDLLIYETGRKGMEEIKMHCTEEDGSTCFRGLLKWLLANENMLLDSNQRSQAMRMKGMHQSYWMMNSMMYKDQKATKEQVEE